MALIPGGGFTHVANASASCSTSFLLEAVSSVTALARARMIAVCLSSMSDFATAVHTMTSKDQLIFSSISSRAFCSALLMMVA